MIKTRNYFTILLLALSTQHNKFRHTAVTIFQFFYLFVTLLLVFYFVSPVEANEQTAQSNRFQIRGFGTVGFVDSDSDQLGFYRNLSQQDGVFERDLSFTADSLLGLQLNVEVTNKLSATLQGILKDRSGPKKLNKLLSGTSASNKAHKGT